MAGERRAHGVRPVTVAAFAKINLSLRVLGLRGDGYHTLETEFQTLTLHDRLTFTPRPGPFAITCDDPACPVDESNLIWRAAARLWRATGHRSRIDGIGVAVEKRIPMQSGLGGGSSDAAAALRGLSKLWRLDVTAERLRRIAADLGADLPYFLQGGTARGTGRGDVIVPLPDHRAAWVVLVLPAFGISTVEAYGWWDRDRGSAPGPVTARREAGNDLEGPVAKRHPQIRQIVRELDAIGSFHAAMSGSGSAVFGLFTSKRAAEAAALALRGRTRRTLITRTLGLTLYKRLSRPKLRLR